MQQVRHRPHATRTTAAAGARTARAPRPTPPCRRATLPATRPPRSASLPQPCSRQHPQPEEAAANSELEQAIPSSRQTQLMRLLPLTTCVINISHCAAFWLSVSSSLQACPPAGQAMIWHVPGVCLAGPHRAAAAGRGAQLWGQHHNGHGGQLPPVGPLQGAHAQRDRGRTGPLCGRAGVHQEGAAQLPLASPPSCIGIYFPPLLPKSLPACCVVHLLFGAGAGACWLHGCARREP